MDKLYKIIYDNDLRIHMVVLEDIPKKIFFPLELDTLDNRVEATSAALIAAVLSSDLKELNSSITVFLKNVSENISYSITARQDGHICGSVSSYTKGVLREGYILEVVRRSGVGHDYSSVVCGKDIDSAFDEYIRSSMQINGFLKRYSSFAVFAEELPFSNILERGRKALTVLDENPSPDVITECERFRIVEQTDLQYGCSCTKRSVKKALAAAISEEEFDFLDNVVEISCKLCGKKYYIEKREL